jgi:dihydroorotate dehydrogenase electron transfer subunit
MTNDEIRMTIRSSRPATPACVQARVVKRKLLAPDVVSVWLRVPEIARVIQPGQFVQVKASSSDEPFLRRPFSVAQQRRDGIRVIFRVVGQGTALLAAARPGDEWNILGPLGRPAPLVRNRNVIIIGGGIGIAPLLFLAERLCRQNRVHVLLGAQNRQELILLPEFRRLGVKLSLATDDGSLGNEGFVTDTLQSVICGLRSAIAPVVFACGPRPMLRKARKLTQGLESYAFWEERMGCGTGICYGCAVKRADGQGYLRFCQEGPVLKMSDIEI